MERGPLIQILKDMAGTDRELDLLIPGSEEPFEIRNVKSAVELHSAHGIKIVTMANEIWIDESHVAAAYQARTDLP